MAQSEGSQARSKALGWGPSLVGVLGFESHPSHSVLGLLVSAVFNFLSDITVKKDAEAGVWQVSCLPSIWMAKAQGEFWQSCFVETLLRIKNVFLFRGFTPLLRLPPMRYCLNRYYIIIVLSAGVVKGDRHYPLLHHPVFFFCISWYMEFSSAIIFTFF